MKRKIKYKKGGMVLRYQEGGMPNWLYAARGRAMRNKMQGGGMYGANTVQAAGQGSGVVTDATANILMAEKDPALQQQRLQAMEQAKATMAQEAEAAANANA